MTIEVEALTKTYKGKHAVRDVSFTVQPGKVTGFLGPNGAGKSTTMRSIVGLDHPTAGRALIDGTEYRAFAAPLREVGALLDAKAAHKSRTALNYLASIAATHRIPRSRVDEVLEATGLSAVARKKVGGFSLGMGQRLGIAAALLGDPGTLILDEPVNGLDPEGVTWVRELLARLAAEGRTVFLSSHLLSELALIADHVIIIGRGEIIADSPLSALTEQNGLRVRVRTPDALTLTRRMTSTGVRIVSSEPELLEVEGLTAEQIARAARETGVLITELTPLRQTLEEAYNHLTRDSVEYASA
ncbi:MULTISPECIES: ATP-binding cassette domain-containing protein [unclassified Pseudoclavibacter]|uniref:ATP-binding cassette domain-containing protein n=1 Tax=unclassified Pseudoclavibacter TaxID=2615177 RepID=UPI000CE8E07A|nr:MULTISPECIES: ATP-binding cassette domain-containing protein [unclassified Pseudoclavibacter]PPF73489.1 multidrug ABC transporter ATP-binding protein [Pseudoclavibacter sp. Z016]PPG01456.1 multidrug ABC transporter ATP-binding protein [Pseudoclavibacter sp. RFBI5]